MNVAKEVFVSVSLVAILLAIALGGLVGGLYVSHLLALTGLAEILFTSFCFIGSVVCTVTFYFAMRWL